MVDRPEHIFLFLPIKYPSPPESEYVQFWWNSYETNLLAKNYHVAFLSFHLLYMSAVYYALYKISKFHPETYSNSLIHHSNDDETYYQNIPSAFSFVKMNEKSVFRFLKIVGADRGLIGEVSKFIQERNEAAHAGGVIFFKDDPDRLEGRIMEYVKALEKIYLLMKNNAVQQGRTWKTSRLTSADRALFVEEKLLLDPLTPHELSYISKDLHTKNPKLSVDLREILSPYFAD